MLKPYVLEVGESVEIAAGVFITLVRTKENSCRLGITAPPGMPIERMPAADRTPPPALLAKGGVQ